MPVPLLDVMAQHEAMKDELRQIFERVVASGQFILGPVVESFEQQLAEHCGARHAVGVSSGTDALLAALMAMEIGPGDEVITTTFSFVATAGCIVRLGATPVFVDIDPGTFNLDVDQIESACTAATKAVMPVHLYGLPVDMGPLMELARSRNLRVIEDAAQAMGARYQGRPVGSIGDAGCLSFYPTKNLPALGDAGACVTSDDELAERIRQIRQHGADGPDHYPTIGGNFRLDALHAAVLGAKLPRLDGWCRGRRRLAERYVRGLDDLPLDTPRESGPRIHAYNQFTIRLEHREPLRLYLGERGIGCRVYYPAPLHMQPCFARLQYERGRLPHAEEAARQVLSLPIYPELTDNQQDEVIGCVRDFFSSQ